MRLALPVGLLLVSLSGPSLLNAQTPEMVSRDQPATFKARVNVVMVPVVVRDQQGRAVTNLRKEDFELFDQGKPQIITKFSVETAAGRSAREPQEPSVDSSPLETPVGQPAPPLLPDRYVAYFFDDTHLEFGDLVRVRDAAARSIADLRPTDRVGIFTSSGQNTVDFTDDRARLREALARLRPRSMTQNSIRECPDISIYQAGEIERRSDLDDLTHNEPLLVAVYDALGCLHLDPQRDLSTAISISRSMAQKQAMLGEHESRGAFIVLKDLIRRMTVLPGDRSIVLASPGFLASDDLLPEEFDLIDHAIHASVVINSLDARGLWTDHDHDIDERPLTDLHWDLISAATVSAERTIYEHDSHVAASSVLANLAVGTGGSFFQNRNDLSAGFHLLAASPECVYMIGFSPENLKTDGHFHGLKVQLRTGAKYSLQARKGYYAPRRLSDPVEQAAQEIRDAVFSRDDLNDLPFALHTQFFKSSETAATLTVVARVDLKRVPFRKAEGRNRDDLTVVSGIFDNNGNLVAAIEKRVEMRLLDQTLDRLQTQSGVTVKTSFDVAPGRYAVRVVVRDAEGQKMAAQTGAVDIP